MVTQLVVQLPESEVAFLENYAQRHKVTVAEVISRYIRQLRIAEEYLYHPEIDRFAGIIPQDVNARKVYHDHIEEKHK